VFTAADSAAALALFPTHEREIDLAVLDVGLDPDGIGGVFLRKPFAPPTSSNDE